MAYSLPAGTGGPHKDDNAQRLLYLIASYLAAVVSSSNGYLVRNAVVETGTTAITGNFAEIHVIADAVLASYTSSTFSGDSLVGVTLPAGTVLKGTFTAFTLTSGKVIAYSNP